MDENPLAIKIGKFMEGCVVFFPQKAVMPKDLSVKKR